MQQSEATWSHGSGAAPIGTPEWADYVRLQLVAMVDHLGENEESFLRYIELVKQHRAWTLLKKKDGSTFRTIEEFCSHGRPWGLGTTWSELRPYLVSGMAKRGMRQDEIDRALQLETVPEPMAPKAGPGRGRKAEPEITLQKTEGRGGPSFSGRVEKRLRSINRAPDTVKDAYREGRISQALAAKLGPKNPPPEVAAKVAEVAAEIRQLPRNTSRKDIDRLVREKLGERVPTIVDKAIALIARMSKGERAEFFRRAETYRGAN